MTALCVGTVFGGLLVVSARASIRPGRPMPVPEAATTSTGRPAIAICLFLGAGLGLAVSQVMDPRHMVANGAAFFGVAGFWAAMALGSAGVAEWVRREERARNTTFWKAAPTMTGRPNTGLYYLPIDSMDLDRQEALRPRLRLVRESTLEALWARWLLLPVALGLCVGVVRILVFGRGATSFIEALLAGFLVPVVPVAGAIALKRKSEREPSAPAPADANFQPASLRSHPFRAALVAALACAVFLGWAGATGSIGVLSGLSAGMAACAAMVGRLWGARERARSVVLWRAEGRNGEPDLAGRGARPGVTTYFTDADPTEKGR